MDFHNNLYTDKKARQQFLNEYYKDSFNCQCATKLYSPRKVIFSEPYETVPNFLINNDFKKGDCKYCDNKERQSCQGEGNLGARPQFNLPFLPFLSSMFSGGGVGNTLGSLFSGGAGGGASPIANMLSNPEILTSISKFLFKNNQTSKPKHNQKSDDFNLDEYTRVE